VEVGPFIKTGNTRKDLRLETKNMTSISDICDIQEQMSRTVAGWKELALR